MPQPLTATIDITPILYGRGVSRYTSNLILSLIKQPNLELKFFGSSLRQKSRLNGWLRDQQLTKHPRALYKLPPTLLSKLWYQLNFPSIETFVPKTQVFHAWEELIPPSRNTPVVATIHDLSVFKYPETLHPSTLYKHTQALKRLKATGSHLIAVSKATYHDIQEYLEVPKEQVHLVYEALPRESKIQMNTEESQKHLKKLQIERPFILAVGTPEPRKNLSNLLSAWKEWKTELDLIIVGSRGWDHLEQEIEAAGARRLMNLSTNSLVALYKGASMCAYPSLYEGFGLPILEAYYHHSPVLTSNRGAMAEIAGNAAELVDPEDIESLSHGIKTLLNESSENKQRRQQAMKLRLQIFHWDTTAEKTLTVYHTAVHEYN